MSVAQGIGNSILDVLGLRDFPDMVRLIWGLIKSVPAHPLEFLRWFSFVAILGAATVGLVLGHLKHRRHYWKQGRQTPFEIRLLWMLIITVVLGGLTFLQVFIWSKLGGL